MIKKIIILIVVVIAIGFAVKFFFSKGETAQTGLSVNGESQALALGGVSSDENDFLSVLLNLKTLKLDDSVFSRTSFKSLRDFSRPLVQTEAEGRPNPFYPIGSDPQVIVPGASQSSSGSQTSGSSSSEVAVVTNPVSDITATTATFSARVIGGNENWKPSFWLGTTAETKTKIDVLNYSAESGTFTLPITNLRSGVRYYLRAVVNVDGQNKMGEVVVFNTL